MLFRSRNKTDQVIRALAQKGGYMGIYNMTLWMTQHDTASVEDIVDHIDHAVKIGGIDLVGLAAITLRWETSGHKPERYRKCRGLRRETPDFRVASPYMAKSPPVTWTVRTACACSPAHSLAEDTPRVR